MTHETLLEIDFSHGGNGDEFADYGLAPAESHGRWTIGTESIIKLPGLFPGLYYTVELGLRPHVAPPTRLAQELTIHANAIACFDGSISQGTEIQFAIPQAALNASGLVELHLHCPNAISPHVLVGSNDVRQLGFSARSLRVTQDGGVADSVPAGADEDTLAAAPAPEPQSANLLNRAPPTLAVVTMVYNEPDFLPIWMRHYGREAGPEHCYIVDHGSDDGSTDALGRFNRLRVPRSPMDEVKRSGFISEFCSALLKWYDFVIYCDVDEFLVADPARFTSLRDLCAKTDADVVTAFGFNIVHWLHHEPSLNLNKPILPQRRWLHPTSSMAKPLLTRRPIVWPGGFHSWDGLAVFDGLFNFHLAYADLDLAWRRQAKRRSVVWADWRAHHHSVDDSAILNQMERVANFPKLETVSLDDGCGPYQNFVSRIRLSQFGRERQVYKTEMNIWGDTLWPLPERFHTLESP